MPQGPIITDPRRLTAAAGSSYLALRPAGDVAEEFIRIQRLSKAELANDDASFPGVHLSLKGFGTVVTDPVYPALATWASRTSPFEVAIQGLTVFQDPRVGLVHISSTPGLAAALKELRSIGAGLPTTESDGIPVDEWIFHLSVVYGERLDPGRWVAFSTWFRALEIRSVATTVSE
ncbi:MAG: hypothetical protein QOI81_1082, partial [Actinomycetota bacterium]|nr:hypothetical protein [Actinomycetota bacterium]